MSLKKLLLALSAVAAASALAQASLGTVSGVNGVATVTTGTTGTTVVTGAPIQSGARFVTTSSGSVTLRLNNGCQVTVPPGHGVTVLSSMSCQQLTAAVQPVRPATTVMGATSGDVALVNGIIVATGALIAIAIIRDEIDDDDEALSPR